MSSRKISNSRLNLETLELRENPAGTVTATLAGGVLTVTGDDAANDITITVTPTNITFTANNGETGLPGSPLSYTGPLTGININMAGGNDDVTIIAASGLNVGSGVITANMGDGDNTLDMSGLSSLTASSISYVGTEGENTFTLGVTNASTISGAVNVTTTTGDLTFQMAGAAGQLLTINGGINATSSYGTSNVTLNRVATTKVTINGNDANTNNGGAFLTMSNTTLTGLLTVNGNFGSAVATINDSRVNGVTLNSKAAAAVSGSNWNYDSINSVAIPTGNIIINAGLNGSFNVNQSGVADSKIGNVTVNAGFGSAIGITNGSVGLTNAKTVGNLSARSSNLQNANISVSGGTSVGLVTASSGTAGDDAVVSISEVQGAVGTITVTAANDAWVFVNYAAVVTGNHFGAINATAAMGTARIDLTRPANTGALTATGVAGANVTVMTANKIGVIRSTSRSGSASVNLSSVTDATTITATGSSSNVQLFTVPKTGAITATANGISTDAFVNLFGSSTGVAATKSGGNVTVTGPNAAFGAFNSTLNVVNGNLAVRATKYQADFDVSSASTALTVEGTTTVTAPWRLDFDLNPSTGATVFKRAVTLTQTNPLFDVDMTAAGASVTFDQNLTVKAAGRSNTQFNTTALSEIKGDYTFTGGQWQDTFTANPNFKAKNFRYDGKNGNTNVSIGSGTSATKVPITGVLTITSGFGSDSIQLVGVDVTGVTTINTGSANDQVNIQNSTLTGASVINLGAGNDSVLVGTFTLANTLTTVTGVANWNLGAGNDTLTLGQALSAGGNAVTNAVFTSPLSKIDGSTGVDLYLPDPQTSPSLSVLSF